MNIDFASKTHFVFFSLVFIDDSTQWMKNVNVIHGQTDKKWKIYIEHKLQRIK